MRARVASRYNARRLAICSAALLAGAAWPALAQTAATPPASTADAPAAQDQSVPEAEQSIVVTGYRASLQSSTNAKKNSVGFTDSIFAEDIGKFPDTNIAESFNRIPGVTIAREVTGEGLNVTIRGLGTNFTRVLLNGAPVAVASTGRTDSQNTNREVDLDMFPTELFTSLTVNKSGIADQVEGGAAGTVNMRSARPFDKSGTHVTYGAQLTKNTNSNDWGYRGSLLGSTTMGDFGILLGVAGVHNKVRTTGFETIGWTNPNLSAAQCGATSGCNPTGGGNWTIPGTVPAGSGAGLVTGATIDQAYLLARNPGATISQIDNGIIPRLGRKMFEEGTKDRINAIASLEYKGDSFHAYVDGMFGWKDNQLERVDMNWVGRNGAAIPLNTQYDRSDCTTGCVVTKGTYANAQWFLEYRPFIEKTKFWGVNPGAEWQIADKLKVDIAGNYTWSSFHRESPSVVVLTAPGTGVVVNYDNTGDVPNITTNIDLNNPANFAWPGGRVNIQDEKRKTETKGIRGNLTWGDSNFNFKAGAAYDDTSRTINAYDNSQAWQNAVCGNRPSVFVPSPNTQPPCNGLVQPGAAPAGYPSYPAYGTGYSAGATGPVTYAGSLISNSQLAGLLTPTSAGFVSVNWDAFKAASNYDAFHNAAPEAGSSNTGASGGYVREKVLGAYAEVNGDLQIGDNNHLNYNAGIRYVHTDQTIGGRVSISDPRNSIDPDGAGPLPAACPGTGNPRDGSCYPNITNFVYTDASYENWLPSVSGAFHIGEAAVVRAAVSRTMTRPNPNTMLPGLNFSTPSADVGSVGNPSLQPYLSTNIDLGFEYYTGKEGYVGFTAFRKAVTGFTTTGTATVPFAALAAYGVTYDTLTPTQQAAINSRGGPTSATVVLSQQVNATGTLKVNGLEVNWVQPLDFLLGRLGLNGFGFNANLTLIDQSGSGAAPAVAVGVSPVTYNLTGYYEKGGINIRLSTTFQRGSVSSDANQNGIALARLYSDDYQQFDMSASVDLAEVFGMKWAPQLTLDVINLTKEKQRSYFQFENAAFTLYDPGRQVMIGLRGRF